MVMTISSSSRPTAGGGSRSESDTGSKTSPKPPGTTRSNKRVHEPAVNVDTGGGIAPRGIEAESSPTKQRRTTSSTSLKSVNCNTLDLEKSEKENSPCFDEHHDLLMMYFSKTGMSPLTPPRWFNEVMLRHIHTTPSFLAFLQRMKKEREQSNIYPPAHQVFASMMGFKSLDQVKVIIVGQDPYHNPGQAHGYSFSIPRHCGFQVNSRQFPPSLRNIYKEVS
jgi:hypothetical protein